MRTDSTQKIMQPLIFNLFSLLQLSDHVLISTLNLASRKIVLTMRRNAISKSVDIWTGLKPDEMRNLPPDFELVVVNASDFSRDSLSLEQLNSCFRMFRYWGFYPGVDGIEIKMTGRSI